MNQNPSGVYGGTRLNKGPVPTEPFSFGKGGGQEIYQTPIVEGPGLGQPPVLDQPPAAQADAFSTTATAPVARAQSLRDTGRRNSGKAQQKIGFGSTQSIAPGSRVRR